MNAYLTKWAIFREKASNRFPINFTSREMNETLVILRTVLHLKPQKKSASNQTSASINQFSDYIKVKESPILSRRTAIREKPKKRRRTTGSASMKLL